MCVICSSPASSLDDLKKATAQHRREKLHERASEIKELIKDCRYILRFHEEAGTQDPETERYLKKLQDEQFALSREM